MIFNKLASAIINDIMSGLQGLHINQSLSIEQLEDDIVDERLQIIKEYQLKGILPINDLILTIDCIKTDCQYLNSCNIGNPSVHFTIPQILNDYGVSAVQYIGAVDKQKPFQFYTSINAFQYRKYRKRGADQPVIFINTTPNKDGVYDCYAFNCPYLKQISITAIFKDPRQLELYQACGEMDDNYSFINDEIKKRLVQKKLQCYRQLATGVLPNDQSYK